jgi:hypothetical protein
MEEFRATNAHAHAVVDTRGGRHVLLRACDGYEGEYPAWFDPTEVRALRDWLSAWLEMEGA